MYTRIQLQNICRRSFIPEAKWHHEGYPDLMTQAGDLFALLCCGCKYHVITEENATEDEKKEGMVTDENSIFVSVSYIPPDACKIPTAEPAEREKQKLTVVFALPTEHILNTHPIYSEQSSEEIKVVNETPAETKTEEPVKEKEPDFENPPLEVNNVAPEIKPKKQQPKKKK